MTLVSTGVPQGFIVGPFAFNIFISDIVKTSSKHTFILYAHDTGLNSTLELFGNDTEEIQNSIVSELKMIKQYKLLLYRLLLLFLWLTYNNIMIIL